MHKHSHAKTREKEGRQEAKPYLWDKERGEKKGRRRDDRGRRGQVRKGWWRHMGRRRREEQGEEWQPRRSAKHVRVHHVTALGPQHRRAGPQNWARNATKRGGKEKKAGVGRGWQGKSSQEQLLLQGTLRIHAM